MLIEVSASKAQLQVEPFSAVPSLFKVDAECPRASVCAKDVGPSSSRPFPFFSLGRGFFSFVDPWSGLGVATAACDEPACITQSCAREGGKKIGSLRNHIFALRISVVLHLLQVKSTQIQSSKDAAWKREDRQAILQQMSPIVHLVFERLSLEVHYQ